ncbi:lantibiotic dehydratase [Chryseobacterium sp.]|uniref:lantibiotic dehydratase n=1 Tax=Chryseobacterium sp. TaxID=1871047 RepID=UPI0025B96AD7|nr:lantibiotic dehydratase [Chryseobacterium sp.]MBV8327462.1 lantibiotic dehydratase [Chryseobacterium sp.]
MFSEKSFKNFQRYIIRKPSFSYDILFIDSHKTKPLQDVVRDLLEDDFFMASIYWSSPELYKTVQSYKKGELKESKKEKLLASLTKYALRASTRATPYGTFAGLGSIDLSEDHHTDQNKRVARIDLLFLDELKKTIENDFRIKPYLMYAVNDSVYEIADSYRFTEPFFSDKEAAQYQLSSLEKTEFIDIIYHQLKEKGKATLQEIRSILPDSFTDEDVRNFIFDLIDSGFITSEVFGIKDLQSLYKVVSRIENAYYPDDKSYSVLLEKISECIDMISNTEQDYLPLQKISELEEHILKKDITCKCIFHIDFLKTAKDDLIYKSLYGQYSGDLLSAIVLLTKLSVNESKIDRQLKNFINVFRTKYENQELPLLSVLDNEFGIGFPAEKSLGNIAHDDYFVEAKKSHSNESLAGNKNSRLNWLYDKIDQAGDTYALEINDTDIPSHFTPNTTISENFAVMGSFHKEHFFIQNIGGAHASLLGRFAYMDEKIDTLCKDIRETEKKDNPDLIFADVCHIPNGKIGNVVRNTSFSDYEIPILTEGPVTGRTQIPLHDLMISIVDNEVILKSEKLNKRIIPRLSNAYNFDNSTIPVFRFLCSLQYQKISGLGFSIDYQSSYKRFFPRIVYKNIILHRASWVLRDSDISGILKSEQPLQTLKEFLKNIKTEQFVMLMDGDNELFIDIRNDSYLRLLLEEIKRKSNIVLTEWLKPADCLDSADQVIIPYRNLNYRRYNSNIEKRETVNITRDFVPGSEWFYVKIYCSSPFSDTLLKDILSPLLMDWKAKNMISSFFFIRYTDPHYHIRLRLHLNEASHFAEILRAFYEAVNPYIENQAVWNIQLDTYKREIERYGVQSMENTEMLFYYDSIFFVQCLMAEYFDTDENTRIFSAIKSTDSYLSVFYTGLEDKFFFCKEMELAFELEFGGEMKKLLYSKFRDCSKPLYDYMRSDDLTEQFQSRADKIKSLSLDKENLPSFVHMSINRWFDSSQRMFEYMIYIFLKNYYNRLLNN